MAEEVKQKFYVVFTVSGKFGAAQMDGPFDTWEDILAVRRGIMERARAQHIDQVQIINWKRID